MQTLAEHADGDKKLAALRAVLHKRRDQVWGVFTGSSQEGLARIVTLAGAPMYQFAQLMDFPALGDEFLEMLARHFGKVHKGKSLALDDLRRMFDHLGRRPGLMRDLVEAMSAEGSTDVDAGLQLMLRKGQLVSAWTSIVERLDAVAKAMLLAVARGLAPLSAECAEFIRAATGSRPTSGKLRVALERLRREGILSRSRPVLFTDPLLEDFLRDRKMADLA